MTSEVRSQKTVWLPSCSLGILCSGGSLVAPCEDTQVAGFLPALNEGAFWKKQVLSPSPAFE